MAESHSTTALAKLVGVTRMRWYLGCWVDAVGGCGLEYIMGDRMMGSNASLVGLECLLDGS